MKKTVDQLLKVEGLQVAIQQANTQIFPLQGVDFAVNENSNVGLVGESGSGKSITALSLLRLLPPNASIAGGSIMFGDQDLLQIDRSSMAKIRGDQISIVFQNAQTSLNPVLTVGSQIADIFRFHDGGSRKASWDVAVDMLDAMGIPEPETKAHEYPHQYSGGMAQRAMIAMALVCSPRLLIADEPTSGLDVTIQAQVLDLIVERVEKQAASLLLISHDIGVIAETCEEVVVMYAGKVMEHGSARELISHPAHPYTEGLMAAFRRQSGDRMYFIPGQVQHLSELHNGCPFVSRCEHATDMCRHEVPELKSLSDDRQVACYHPLN